jgi:hypothetical protein
MYSAHTYIFYLEQTFARGLLIYYSKKNLKWDQYQDPEVGMSLSMLLSTTSPIILCIMEGYYPVLEKSQKAIRL